MTTSPKRDKADRREALRDLRDLLDAYGADPTRWPQTDARRSAAWILLRAGDPDALQLQAQAAALDSAIGRLGPAPAPSAALTGRILQAAERPGRWNWREQVGTLWKPAGALACAALLGVMVGVLSPVPVSTGSGQQLASLEKEFASLTGLEQSTGFGEFAE